MKIINSSSVLIDRPYNQLRLAEEIGRTCYKSNDLITEESYKKFCNGLLKRKHLAMLEHAVFHFCINRISIFTKLKWSNTTDKPIAKGYDHFIIDNFTDDAGINNLLVTANLRAILETGNIPLITSLLHKYKYLECLDVSDYLVDTTMAFDFKTITWVNDEELKNYLQDNIINKKTYLRHCCITAKFICNRAVSHELVRHRLCSFAQVSQRYVNYSKEKFGKEITFIQPLFYTENEKVKEQKNTLWRNCCKRIEWTYFQLLNEGLKPEEARGILSNDVATEIYITALGEEWQHIINLRAFGTTGKPHPQMKQVIYPIAEELINQDIGFVKPGRNN